MRSVLRPRLRIRALLLPLLPLAALAAAGPAQAQERVLELSLDPSGGAAAVHERLVRATLGVTDMAGAVVTARYRFTRPVADLRLVEPQPVPGLVATGLLDAGQAPEGDQPDDVEITRDGTTAICLDRDTSNLTFLDLATDAIVATVPVGAQPEDLELTPDGLYALTADTFSDTLSVVRLADRTVVAQVPVGVQPVCVRVTPDSAFALVGNLVDQTVSKVDLATFTVVGTGTGVPLAVTGGSFTFESAQSSNDITDFELAEGGATLVVEDAFADDLVFFDVASLSLLGRYDVPGSAIGSVAISPDGTVATVARTTTPYEYHAVDVATRTALTTPTPLPTTALGRVNAITPDNAHGVVEGLNEVFVVDLATGTLTATLSTGSVGDVLFDSTASWMYVSNFNARVFDLATFGLVQTISVDTQQEAAASPVGPDVVGISRFGEEDLLHFTVTGPTSAFVASTRSGELPEGDAPRAVSVTPDGSLAVVADNVSDDATIVDLDTDSVVAIVDLAGDRIGDVEITPDGSTAVVSCIDTDTLAVVDLATRTLVASVGTRGRPDQLAITSDGSLALVATLNNGSFDYVSVVALAGAASSHVADVAVGQLGLAVAGNSVNSGLALTPDDAYCLVANSFDDDVDVIDVAALSVVASVPVGDFPIRIAVSPDGTEAAVSNAFGDSVTFLALAGPATSAITTVTGADLDYPIEMRWTPDSAYVDVSNLSSGMLVPIRKSDHAALAALDLDTFPLELERTADGSRLYASVQSAAEVEAVDVAGASLTSVLEVMPGADPSGLDVSRDREVVTAAVIAPDQVQVVHEAWSLPYGTGKAGSAGVPALAISARPVLGTSPSFLLTGAAAGRAATVYYASAPASIDLPPGGQLLLLPPLFGGPIATTDGSGAASFPVTLPSDLALAGARYYLQAIALDLPSGFSLTQGLEVGLWP